VAGDQLDTYTFDDDGSIPNSAFPALVYRGALNANAGAATYEELFARHAWLGRGATASSRFITSIRPHTGCSG
jgi:uncharacterized protein YjlB